MKIYLQSQIMPALVIPAISFRRFKNVAGVAPDAGAKISDCGSVNYAPITFPDLLKSCAASWKINS